MINTTNPPPPPRLKTFIKLEKERQIQMVIGLLKVKPFSFFLDLYASTVSFTSRSRSKICLSSKVAPLTLSHGISALFPYFYIFLGVEGSKSVAHFTVALS